MGRFDLNLSTRPFPAYRAVNLALFGIFLFLIALSVWQAYSFLNYSALSADIREEEQNSRVGAEVLKENLEALEARMDQPDVAAKLAEIEFFNRLIARRNLSWTRVFATLEDIVPDSVHLTSLAPEVSEDGRMLFQLQVRARSIADVSEFIENVEQSPVFEKVTVSQEEKREASTSGEVDVTLDVQYLPEKETP